MHMFVRGHTVFKWVAYRYDNVKCVINCIFSLFIFFSNEDNERIEKGYQAFVKDDYTQVLICMMI